MWPCNLFGGRAACRPVAGIGRGNGAPKTGTGGARGEEKEEKEEGIVSVGMMQQCAVDLVNPTVDCAYTLEEREGQALDPDVVVRARLQQAGYSPPCEPCLQALHRFWCGQTVPTCGTFEKIVDEVLPELRQITTGQEKPDELIEAALPRMLAAFSLGLPCKEMCLEVTSLCSCGQITTFGQAMEFLEAARPGKGPNVRVPVGFTTGMSNRTAEKIFKHVWDRHVCDLFSPSVSAGSGGREGEAEEEERGGEEEATEAPTEGEAAAEERAEEEEVQEVETEEAAIEAEEKKELDFGGIDEGEDSAVSWEPQDQVLGTAGAADVMGGMETGGRTAGGRAAGGWAAGGRAGGGRDSGVVRGGGVERGEAAAVMGGREGGRSSGGDAGGSEGALQGVEMGGREEGMAGGGGDVGSRGSSDKRVREEDAEDEEEREMEKAEEEEDAAEARSGRNPDSSSSSSSSSSSRSGGGSNADFPQSRTSPTVDPSYEPSVNTEFGEPSLSSSSPSAEVPLQTNRGSSQDGSGGSVWLGVLLVVVVGGALAAFAALQLMRRQKWRRAADGGTSYVQVQEMAYVPPSL
ncbi:unnamed protein product [Closterium sp. NIES-65]|nr:unnamed protein product [Closterium sp. NIES-65]